MSLTVPVSVGDSMGSTPSRNIGNSNVVMNCPITTKTMRKVEAGMVCAIHGAIHSDKSGRIFNSGNTEVHVIHEGVHGTYTYNRYIEVLLHGNTIATIYPLINRIKLSDCGYETNTTKSRLNVLFECFTDACGVHQKNHIWFQGNTEWDGECECEFTQKHPDDHWQTKQALKLA